MLAQHFQLFLGRKLLLYITITEYIISFKYILSLIVVKLDSILLIS